MKIYSTIPEARAALIRECKKDGYRQDIERGSFEKTGIYRVQLPVASCEITNHTFDRVPVPPPADWPVEMTTEAGENYFINYLLTGYQLVNESYTYGSRMAGQLNDVMEMLRSKPGTNQAAVSIGREADTWLNDPACLREIHFKYFGKRLHLYCIWRSHDLVGGFPLNLFGLSRLLEMVSEYAGLDLGSIFYYSTGSHIYSYSL